MSTSPALTFNAAEQDAWNNFHSERYTLLNTMRWDLLLRTGIQLAGKIIFEPGAGIGDQTEWLLAQGAAHVIVSDGRETNLAIIRQRFAGDERVTCLLGNLEDCLDRPEFSSLCADLTYLWGVYYHINDAMPDFPILQKLARIAPTVVLDYLESGREEDWVESYNYDNPSTSISRRSPRPLRATMLAGLRKTYGHAYWPKTQMEWHDPSATRTPRKIVIGSTVPLDWPGVDLMAAELAP